MATILIIDDDRMICRALGDVVLSMGHSVQHALRLKEGLAKVATGEVDLVFLDVYLPDGDGLKAIPSFRQAPSTPEVIIITGHGVTDGAEIAIRSGAWDYIQKPLSVEEITLALKRVLQYRDEKQTGKSPSTGMKSKQGNHRLC